MKNNQIIRAIASLTIAAISMNVNAQNCPSVTIAPANIITSSTTYYSFSSTGKKVGIMSGTVNSGFNFQANDTLYIAAGATFTGNISGFTTGCAIINCGTSDVQSFSPTGGRVDNYNTLKSSYFNLSNTVFNNYSTFAGTGNLTLGGTSTVTNTGNITAGYTTIASGATFTNNGPVHVGQVALSGTLINKSMFVGAGQFDVNAGATFSNSCRFVANVFNNNTDGTANYGFMWITSNANGAFNNKGAFTNAGYLRTTQFKNNGSTTISNTANNSNTNNVLRNGYIRVEGGSGSNESQNNGTIAGGYVADAYNQYAFDIPGTITGITGMIPALDTNTVNNSGIVALNCYNSNNNIGTLPIHLVSFSGNTTNGTNNLNWTVADVKDMKSMELEYSENGSNYETLDYTSLLNNDNVSNTSYSFAHKSATSVSYYRIKFTDNHEVVTYSNVVRLVSDATTATGVSYYPNPFHDNVTVNVTTAAAQTVRINVLDLTGKMIQTMTYNTQAGANAFSITNMGDLMTGIYILQVNTENESFQYKIVKQ
ncbi:T9SS type A sorting domain-containing protein [Chitinophagaceae bacterium MMS25-I14]